jgi:MFS family permease
MIGAIRAGLRFARYNPALRVVLVRTAAFVIGASAMWAMLPLIARVRLGLDAAGFGVLLAWFGTGAAVGGAVLNRVERLASLDNLVHLSTAVFLAMTAGLAITHNSLVACALLAAGGAAWVTVFSILNVIAQLSVPQWVQGRSLAMYQVVMQGGMAAASAMWGTIGERYGLSTTLWCGVAALAAGFAAFRWRLPRPEDLDADTTVRLPSPVPAFEIDPDRGPAMVMIEYRIDPARAAEFAAAMQEMRTIRLRDNAVFWGLFADVDEPDRCFECFATETWGEHLRQHERLLASDVVYQARARSFHVRDALPTVTHLVSIQTITPNDASLNARDGEGAAGPGEHPAGDRAKRQG